MTYTRMLEEGSSSSFAEFSLATGDDFWIPPSRLKNFTTWEMLLAPGYDTKPIFGRNYYFEGSIREYSIFNNQQIFVWKVSAGSWTLYFTKDQSLLVGAEYLTWAHAFLGPDLKHTINYTLTSSNINFSEQPSKSQLTPGFELVAVLVLLGILGRFVLIRRRLHR
ncbi:MAG: hypothetical protein ACFFCQ_02620 [Promethearchaeota archaeon]